MSISITAHAQPLNSSSLTHLDNEDAQKVTRDIEHIQSITKAVFSNNAQLFLFELKDRMSDMVGHKAQRERNIEARGSLDPYTIQTLISENPKIKQYLPKTSNDLYSDDKSYFKHTTFEKFETLFEVE